MSLPPDRHIESEVTVSNKAVVSVLTEMNEDPGNTARSLRAFQRSARVLSNDHPRLINEYPDQWVAVTDSTVIAHGDTLEQVLAQIDAKDIPRADVIVRFIERTQRTLIL